MFLLYDRCISNNTFSISYTLSSSHTYYFTTSFLKMLTWSTKVLSFKFLLRYKTHKKYVFHNIFVTTCFCFCLFFVAEDAICFISSYNFWHSPFLFFRSTCHLKDKSKTGSFQSFQNIQHRFLVVLLLLKRIA